MRKGLKFVLTAVSAALLSTLLPSAVIAPASATTLTIDYQGAWSATTNYAADNVVTSRGSLWRAMRANINKEPGSTNPSSLQDGSRWPWVSTPSESGLQPRPIIAMIW